MRIPKGFSDELRNQADIVKIVGDYVSLKKKGNNYWACCPFHGEKTPSFSVNANKGFFKCFGCGKAGDVFRFVMEIEGASFPEAVQTVAEKAGVSLPVFEESKEFEERDRFRAELQQLNQWAVEFFEQSLTATGEGRRGLAYLEQRGVQEETRKLFKLGYAPNSWDALISYLKTKGATITQIERSGLVSLKETGGSYDKFRGRLMFPICDAQGRVVAFGGRILGEGEPKYLNSPETALYTKGLHLFGLSHARDAIRQRGFAILVEGYLDFLIPYQAGVKNLVASLGTALTEHQVRLLGRYAQKIIVNFDPDAAGVNATKRSLELLLGQGFKVNVLTLPDNLDPDEFIRARGAEGYNQLLKTSQSFLDYIVEQAVGAHDQTRPAGKIETVNAILPYLRLVNDKLERSEQIVRIADRLRIDSKLLREEFKKAVETKQERVSDRALRETIAVKSAEQKLLEVLLNRAPLRRRLLQQLREEDFAGLRTEKLFRLIFEFEQKNIELNYAELTHVLLEGTDEEVDEALARDLLPRLWILEEAETDPNDMTALKAWWREAAESLHSLRCERLAEKQVALQMEINQAQRANDAQRLNDLMMHKFELAKRERALANWSPSEA
jgi:DNA primase